MSETLDDYPTTVFKLLMVLAARVNASLKQKTPETFAANQTEVKVCQRIEMLYGRLTHMEKEQGVAAPFSSAVERLMDRISGLLMPNGEMNPNITLQNQSDFPLQISKITDIQPQWCPNDNSLDSDSLFLNENSICTQTRDDQLPARRIKHRPKEELSDLPQQHKPRVPFMASRLRTQQHQPQRDPSSQGFEVLDGDSSNFTILNKPIQEREKPTLGHTNLMKRRLRSIEPTQQENQFSDVDKWKAENQHRLKVQWIEQVIKMHGYKLKAQPAGQKKRTSRDLGSSKFVETTR